MTDPVRRLHFFPGQLVSVEDLEADQDYHREMRYLHNRLLGSGLVNGLEVTVDGEVTLVVSPGVAIDGLGREIVLTSEVRLDPSPLPDQTTSVDVTIHWQQLPDAFSDVADSSGQAFARWLEHPKVSCGPPGQAIGESLVLARVTRSAGAIAIDRSVSKHFPSPADTFPLPCT